MNHTHQHVAQSRNPIDWNSVGKLSVDESDPFASGKFTGSAPASHQGMETLAEVARAANLTEDETRKALSAEGLQNVLALDGGEYFDSAEINKFLAKLNLTRGPKSKPSAPSRDSETSVLRQSLTNYRATPVKASGQLAIDRKGGVYGAGVIRNVSLITEGEAVGHEQWADTEFVSSVADHVNRFSNGVKVRFTHPMISGDGLGRFMGRAMKARAMGNQALADVHLAKASRETPDGDLGKYVMDLAEEDPEAFAMSIVFKRDKKAERIFQGEHGGHQFRSPAKGNTSNYPHVRLEKLVAADFVDEPAANPGGLFHRGSDIADEADRLCAYAFGLSEEKPELKHLGADADRLAAFARRFVESRGLTSVPAEG